MTSRLLIGLLFVVVTLSNSRDRERALRAVSIYMTPTAVNFGLAAWSSTAPPETPESASQWLPTSLACAP